MTTFPFVSFLAIGKHLGHNSFRPVGSGAEMRNVAFLSPHPPFPLLPPAIFLDILFFLDGRTCSRGQLCCVSIFLSAKTLYQIGAESNTKNVLCTFEMSAM
jgi:hypothetical protein